MDEACHLGTDVGGTFTDLLPGLPAGVRRHAQPAVYRELHQSGDGPYRPDTVAAALHAVADRLGYPTDRLLQAAE